MRNFRELEIWKNGMKICSIVYDMIESFPDSERYGLRSQITRCAVSIPSNIAEGCSRTSELDFARFLEISLGSCYELETQMIIAKEKFWKEHKDFSSTSDLLTSQQKMTTAFISKLKQSLKKPLPITQQP